MVKLNTIPATIISTRPIIRHPSSIVRKVSTMAATIVDRQTTISPASLLETATEDIMEVAMPPKDSRCSHRKGSIRTKQRHQRSMVRRDKREVRAGLLLCEHGQVEEYAPSTECCWTITTLDSTSWTGLFDYHTMMDVCQRLGISILQQSKLVGAIRPIDHIDINNPQPCILWTIPIDPTERSVLTTIQWRLTTIVIALANHQPSQRFDTQSRTKDLME